jgi:triosephosphate isomerase
MKSILVANWKMNPPTFKEAKKLFDATKKAAEAARNVSVIVAPPALYLRELAMGYKGKRLSFAAQHMHFELHGSYTGELSPLQVRDAKAAYIIIGHAERRAMGETNEDVARKVRAAQSERLTPILCIGESTRSGGGEHFNTVREQLQTALADVPSAKLDTLMLAYEPVWAIGAAKPMSPRDMHEMAIFIRKMVVELHGPEGMRVKILYGGAIDETNAREMRDDGDIVGFIVGRASHDPEKIALLIRSLSA